MTKPNQSKRHYRTTDASRRIVMVIEAIRTLSPPSVTFPNGKAVRIADVVRMVMLSGYGIQRTTARYWITAHDGFAWRVNGNEVALLPTRFENTFLSEIDQPRRVVGKRDPKIEMDEPY